MDVPSVSGIGAARQSGAARAERKFRLCSKCFRCDGGASRDRSPQHNRAGKDFA